MKTLRGMGRKILGKFPASIQQDYWRIRASGVPLSKYVRLTKEVELITLLPFRPKTIVDIGANHGHWTAGLLEVLEESRFYLFEPTPNLYTNLVSRFSPNSNVYVSQIAISAQTGTAEFNISSYDDMSSLEPVDNSVYFIPSPTQQIMVNTDTLDNIYSAVLSNQKVDLLKLDTQGHEHKILTASNTALANTKAILIEWNIVHLYQSNSDFMSIHQLLTSKNFVLSGITNQNRWGHKLAWCDALYVNRDYIEDPYSTPF